MPQALTASNSRIPTARSAVSDVRFARGARAAAISQRDGGIPSWDPETLTFEFVLASETPCREYRYAADGWDCIDVDEVLSMDGIENVDLLVGAPILDMHNSYSLRNVIGVIEAARVEGTQLICRGRLWDRQDLADVIDGIAKGILRNMSVGFSRSEETYAERTGQMPLVTVTKWQPAEASVVAVPADPTAQTRAAGAKPQKPPRGALRKPSSTPAQRTAAMATKPTRGKRAADAENAAAIEEAEATLEAAQAAVAAAQEMLDGARAKSGQPAGTRAKREEMASDDESGERAGEDAEGQEDADNGAEEDEDKDCAKARAKAEADKRSALVAGLRIVAQRRGKEVLEEFDAFAAAGSPLSELRTFAMEAVRSKAGLITSTTGAVRAQAEKPDLRSFTEIKFGRRAAPKAR